MLEIDPKDKKTEKLINEFLITLDEINKHMDEREQYIASLERQVAKKTPIRFFLKRIFLKILKGSYQISNKLGFTRFLKTLINKFPKLNSYISKKLKA